MLGILHAVCSRVGVMLVSSISPSSTTALQSHARECKCLSYTCSCHVWVHNRPMVHAIADLHVLLNALNIEEQKKNTKGCRGTYLSLIRFFFCK